MHGKSVNTYVETWWMVGGALGRNAGDTESPAKFFPLLIWVK